MKPMKTIALILCLAFSFQAQGFWIIGGNVLDDHGSITGRALEKYFYEPSKDYFIKQIDADSDNVFSDNHFLNTRCDGQKCSFNILTKDRIAGFNADIDGGNTIDDPNYHCDDERITECAKIVYGAGVRVRIFLLQTIKDLEENYTSSSDIAHFRVGFSNYQEIFGRSLHTLQDFYSHSNWVERSLYGERPLYGEARSSIAMHDAFIDKKNFDAIHVNKDIFTTKNYHIDLPIDHTCITGPKWSDKETSLRYNIIFLDNLITGFYHKSPDIYKASQYCNVPGSKTNNSSSSFSLDCLIDDSIRKLGFVSENVSISYDGPYFTKNPNPYDEENKYFQSKEKCIHSSSPKPNPSTWGALKKPSYIGIAKDHPGTIHHDAAVDIAVRATTAYTKHIIDEVVKRAGEAGYNHIYTDWVILTFLGYELELNFNVPIYQSGLDTLNIKEEESITVSARTAFEDVETQQSDLIFSFAITEGSDIISISQNDAEVIITGTKVGQATILVTAIDEDEFVGTKSFEVEVGEIPCSEKDSDIVSPVIELNGQASITLSRGGNYIEAGATATDDVDGNITVTLTGAVNIDVSGVYTIIYTAIDNACNTSEIKRIVQVLDNEEEKLPIVTLRLSTHYSLVSFYSSFYNIDYTGIVVSYINGDTIKEYSIPFNHKTGNPSYNWIIEGSRNKTFFEAYTMDELKDKLNYSWNLEVLFTVGGSRVCSGYCPKEGRQGTAEMTFTLTQSILNEILDFQ